MAINIEVAETSRPRKRRARVESIDGSLVPRGYMQITLSLTDPSSVAGTICPAVGGMGAPPGAKIVVINVEGAALRYSDSDQPSSTYGELWTAGQAFVRKLRDPNAIQLCAAASGAIANISFYSDAAE